MERMDESSHATIEQVLRSRVPLDEVKDWIQNDAVPFQELMAYYRCAMMEIETKFRVLSEEFSLEKDNNPIEVIRSRLKSPSSIVEKMLRKNYPINVRSIEENLSDVAGVRVICSFESELYMLADALLRQDDVTLLERKDYIASPKPSGYRSLHLVVATPIFLHRETKMMKVEVQLRTMAMDMWASLEHKIRYKKEGIVMTEAMTQKLWQCAEASEKIDRIMEEIQKESRTQY